MLIERYNEKTKEYECFDDSLQFIVFTGYGKSKLAANRAYHAKVFVKNPYAINLNVGA